MRVLAVPKSMAKSLEKYLEKNMIPFGAFGVYNGMRGEVVRKMRLKIRAERIYETEYAMITQRTMKMIAFSGLSHSIPYKMSRYVV